MRKIVCGLLALAAAATATAAAAWPMGYMGYGHGKLYETHYFTDAGFEEEIGAFIEYCDGHTASWGGVSGQSTYAWYDCEP